MLVFSLRHQGIAVLWGDGGPQGTRIEDARRIPRLWRLCHLWANEPQGRAPWFTSVLTVLAPTRFKFREVGRPNRALPRASFNHSLGGKPKKKRLRTSVNCREAAVENVANHSLLEPVQKNSSRCDAVPVPREKGHEPCTSTPKARRSPTAPTRYTLTRPGQRGMRLGKDYRWMAHGLVGRTEINRPGQLVIATFLLHIHR
jgi:hypothetical protein